MAVKKKTRKSAIGISRVVKPRSQDERLAIAKELIKISVDCGQAALYVSNSEYPRARKNVRDIIKRLTKVSI